MKPLENTYYLQNDSTWTKANFPATYENTAVIAPFDMDKDGDLDVFIGNQMITTDFGKTPKSYLLKNTNGNFAIEENKALTAMGMLTDAIWSDFDGDGVKDLIAIGEWMAPSFFKNTNGKLTKVQLLEQEVKGLWQRIAPFDIDGDGDLDYLLGNFGLNSKFKASLENPMHMYYADFDKNGSTETIVAIAKDGAYYPLGGLDDLAGQMVYLKKTFPNYTKFAGKNLTEIFSKPVLDNAQRLEVNELRSGSFLVHDFDGDGNKEALAAGNYFGVKPYHGRFDAFPGAMITSENDVILGDELGLDFLQKSARHLRLIRMNNQDYVLAVFNNDTAQVYIINK